MRELQRVDRHARADLAVSRGPTRWRRHSPLWRGAILVLGVLALATTVPVAAAREPVYLTKGFGADVVYQYRPRVISLGSTGIVKNLRWRRWNSGAAVGRGTGVPYSSSVAPGASRDAVVRVSGRRRCGSRLIYTRVRYHVFDLSFSERLNCTTGVHP